MARNRKRRSERRPDEPSDGELAEPGVATARRGGSPAPLEHAAGEAELVEAQLARGRAQDADAEDGFDAPELDEDFDEREVNGSSARSRAGRGGGALVPSQSSMPGARVVRFLQGSWRELQRVQWPDRPQVMQATGVVIGFVIIAGLFLGLSDFVSQRIVNFILK